MVEVNHEAMSRMVKAVASPVAQRIARRARMHAKGEFDITVDEGDAGGMAVVGHGGRAFELEYGLPETPGTGWGVRSVMGDVE